LEISVNVIKQEHESLVICIIFFPAISFFLAFGIKRYQRSRDQKIPFFFFGCPLAYGIPW